MKKRVWCTDRREQNVPNLLQSIRKWKYVTALFGDFDFDSLKYSISETNNKIVLSADNYKRQNSKPTLVRTISSTCIDHIKTTYEVERKKVKTTKSHHCSVSGKNPGIVTAPESNEPKRSMLGTYRSQRGRKLKELFISSRSEAEKTRSYL